MGVDGRVVVVALVVLGIFAVSATGAFFSGRARYKKLLGVFGVLWTIFTGGLFLAMANATGWDGIGYAIALMFGAAPSGLGLLIGGLTGLGVAKAK